MGIRVPIVYDYDPYGNSITFERIDGVVLSQFLSANEETGTVLPDLGRVIGAIHSKRITHGDLTTNNIMVMDGKVCLIDPSMGKIVECSITFKIVSGNVLGNQ